MSYLIRGSVAFDEIQLHQGLFEHHILPEHIKRLNISFEIHESHDEFGGNAASIAYNAGLLGDHPIVNAAVGAIDGQALIDHLIQSGAQTQAMLMVPERKSARITMLADSANNQISTFQAGALKYYTPLPSDLPTLAHLSPEMAINMSKAAEELIAHRVPYFLDPGQSLCNLIQNEGNPSLSFDQVLWRSGGLFVNEYEALMITKHFDLSLEDIAAKLPFVVRTLGHEGSELLTGGTRTLIPVCTAAVVKDPTGCGDAFRGGFIHAYLQGHDLVTCCRLGSVMGSFAVEHAGGQNHKPSRSAIFERFEAHYGPYPQKASFGIHKAFF